MSLNRYPSIQPNLTGLSRIVADDILLINNDTQIEEDVRDIFFYNANIASNLESVVYDIGGGQTVVLKEFVGEISNTRVPGLQAILDYLQQNYYDKLDPAINYNYFTTYRKTITMITIFTTQQQKILLTTTLTI